VSWFNSFLHVFSQQFVIVLDGEPIAVSYFVDLLLGEFAAAVVGSATAIPKDLEDEDTKPISYAVVTEEIHSILHSSYLAVYPDFLVCLDHSHKHFLWTGPELQIILESEPFDSIIPLLTMGELLEFLGHPIYNSTARTHMPSSPIPMAMSGASTNKKRHVQADSSEFEVDQPKNCRR
jgi:hypothetical protein